jgi:hypothetical protein
MKHKIAFTDKISQFTDGKLIQINHKSVFKIVHQVLRKLLLSDTKKIQVESHFVSFLDFKNDSKFLKS